jgi:hypothetical protein
MALVGGDSGAAVTPTGFTSQVRACVSQTQFCVVFVFVFVCFLKGNSSIQCCSAICL